MSPEKLFRKATLYAELNLYPELKDSPYLRIVEDRLYDLLDRIKMSKVHYKMIHNKIKGIKRSRSPNVGNKRAFNSRNLSTKSKYTSSFPSPRPRKTVKIHSKYMNMKSLARSLPVSNSPPVSNSLLESINRLSMRNTENSMRDTDNKNKSKRSRHNSKNKN